MEYAGVLSDDEDFLELVDLIQNRHLRRPKSFQNRSNHFEKWTDDEFLKRFRLSKNGVQFVLHQIMHLITLPTERYSI